MTGPAKKLNLSAELYGVLDKQRQYVQHERNQAFQARPEEAAWAALTPFWTSDAAKAAGFPGRLAGSPFLADTGDGVYRMPDEVRIAYLTDRFRSKSDSQGARATLARIGSALLKAGEKPVPQPLRMWARLAASAEPRGAAAAACDSILDPLFGARPKGTPPPAEVFNWIAAATPLAEILGRLGDPSLLQALQRAGRRAELVERELGETARLAHYLPRPHQDRAVHELLSPSSTPTWAAHFIGAGATGKTMLMRHVGWHLAAAEGAAHARIDFDYLSPDYPRVAPGLLLWAFAQELRAFAADSWPGLHFDKAEEVFQRVRDAAGGGEASGVDHRDFPVGLDAFGQGLDALSNGGSRRVVLILDTCEELTRLDGDRRNVLDTFRILEGLYCGKLPEGDRPPSGKPARPYLRVIFSGRKLLARSGANYSGGDTDLPPRDYLLLQEIRGFTDAEAREYLTVRHPVPPEYVAPIMSNSPDVGSVVRVQWAGASEAGQGPCFNPFALNELAQWVWSEPRPALKELATLNSSGYVELRIVRRIADPDARRLLPVVAAAGHFDVALLEAVTGWPDDRARKAADVLDRQEWTTRHAGGGGAPGWSVEPVLRWRMAAYFASRSGWAEDCRSAADHLTGKTLRESIDRLDWTAFDATFGVLAESPPRLVEWWAEAESRVVRARGWAWLADTMRRVLGAWGARPDGEAHSAWPFLAAAYAAALQRVGGDELRRAGQMWQRVADRAPQFPVPAVAANLRLRGRALAVADASPIELSLVRLLWQAVKVGDPALLDTPTSASLVAALRKVVEHVARNKAGEGPLSQPELRDFFDLPHQEPNPDADWNASGPRRLLDFINDRSRRLQGDASSRDRACYRLIQACHCLLLGHVQLLLGFGRRAASIVADAAGFARALDDRPPDEAVADLLPSIDAKSSLLADCIELLYPRYAPVGVVGGLPGGWVPPRPSAEADRFLFCLIRLWGAFGPGAQIGMRAGDADSQLTPDPPSLVAQSPCYYAGLFGVTGLLGRDPANALRRLAGLRSQLPPARRSEVSQALFDSYGKIVLRFRLLDLGLRPLVELTGADPAGAARLAFQCEQMAGYRLDTASADSARDRGFPPEYAGALESDASPAQFYAREVRAAERRSDDPLGRLRAYVLWEAFGGEVPQKALREVAEWVGLVAAAEVAVDAAEVLCLLRPAEAARLYRRAAGWYQEAGHFAGAFVAALSSHLGDPSAGSLPIGELYDSLRDYLTARTTLREVVLPARDRLQRDLEAAGDDAAELLPSVPLVWRPLLTRWLVLTTSGMDRPERTEDYVLRNCGRRAGDRIVPPPDLAKWVGSRPRPTVRPGELLVNIPAEGDVIATYLSAEGTVLTARHPYPRDWTDAPLRTGLESVLDRWAAASPEPEVVLDVFADRASHNWEARVAVLTNGHPFRVRRVTDGRLSTRAQPRPSRLVAAIETGPSSYNIGFAEQGWDAIRAAGGELIFLSQPQRWEETHFADLRALHVIGSPLAGDGDGRRLRVRGRGTGDAPGTAQFGADAGAEFFPDVALTDVTARYPNLVLCVLQAPPIVEQGAGAGNEDDARLFREFAHELFAAGIPAVLALPPLRLEQAGPAIAQVALTFTKPEADAVGGLIRAVASLRDSLAPDVPGGFTPCLYVDRDWSPG